jgi:hypothetical protein
VFVQFADLHIGILKKMPMEQLVSVPRDNFVFLLIETIAFVGLV